MTNVSSFVAINPCVFDNYSGTLARFVLAEGRSLRQYSLDNRSSERRAIQPEVEETWVGYCDLTDSQVMRPAQQLAECFRDPMEL